jgi:hypothetical protein
MEKIELRKVRDFGAVFNDVIAFLTKNFKSFFGILMILAGPFIILTGLLSGYMQSLQSKLVSSNGIFGNYFGTYSGLIAANFIGTLSIFFLIYILTTLVTSSTICLYFKVYDKATEAELPIEKNSIASNLASTCWRLFNNMLLLTLIIVIGGGVLVAIFAVLFMIPVLNILVGIALVVGCIIIIPLLMYVVNAATYIVIRDEVLITVALRKTVDYLRGNFWWTWLLMLCVLLALGTISTLFNLPITLMSLTKMFTRGVTESTGSSHSVLYLVFGAVSFIGRMLVIVPISTAFCIFNFYSHEEQHEGNGLMSLIDKLDEK